MPNSKQLAGLIGPTLIAIGATEALNMDIYASQIAPVVYLNGTVLFVVGLALVRAHNRWTTDWRVLVTLTGWTALIVGLIRMIAPDAAQADRSILTYSILAVIVVLGVILTLASYGGRNSQAQTPRQT
jgi:hypothetical protein